jgi:hypothetical protein
MQSQLRLVRTGSPPAMRVDGIVREHGLQTFKVPSRGHPAGSENL